MEIVWLGSAPLPSTRSRVPFSSARLTITAACAGVARAPNVTSETASTNNNRKVRIFATFRPPRHRLSADRDAVLLGYLGALVVGDGYGEGERSRGCGGARQPARWRCRGAKTWRDLPGDDRPGVRLHTAVGEEVHEVERADRSGRAARVGTRNHQWARRVDGEAEVLLRGRSGAVLDLDC